MSKRLTSLINRARLLIEQSETIGNVFNPTYEIYVFDFDLTLHSQYKPLQCVEILKHVKNSGIPCYVVTAREANRGHEQHISDVLASWGIKMPIEDIFAVGELDKGPVVRNLILRHSAEKCTFWDDKDYNCDSVFDECCEIVDELHIYQLSTAIPGDIRKEITKDVDNQKIEIKHRIEERKIFRNWRRLSKII